MPAFESFIPSINAFGSLIWPSDPIVATVFPGVTDGAAGSLARDLGGGKSDPFGMEVIRLYRNRATSGLTQEGSSANLSSTEEQGIDLFAELDAQAVDASFADFAAMYASDISQTGPAFLLLQGIIAGTVNPLTDVGGPAGLFFIYVQGWRAVSIAYDSNHGKHRVRANLKGFGPDDPAPPIYSDEPNKVANPNDRAIGQGGTATVMTAWGHRGWPFPARQGLNDLHVSAMLNWHLPAAEPDLLTLKTAYETSTAINIG